MTYNQIIKLFNDISDAHQQIATFGDGSEWEIEELALKPGIKYPIFYAIPVDDTVSENTHLWQFRFTCFARVRPDKSNENEVLSDTNSILNDFVKILKNEPEAYNVLNDPIWEPFIEKYGDLCAGWSGLVQFETELNNNYCDVPIEGFNQGTDQRKYGIIKITNSETGAVIEEFQVKPGESLTYFVEVLTEIIQSLDNPQSTIIQVL